jgi:hypothetical protein
MPDKRAQGAYSLNACAWRLAGLFTIPLWMLCLERANGAEYGRPVTVTSTLSEAAQRPALTIAQNYTRIYVRPAAWGASTCREDAADLSKSDSHLLAQLLTALQTGKTITIFVDDTLRPVDTVCQVTMIQISEPQ